jgi:hypothetical protein
LARQLRFDGSSARDQNQFYKNLIRLGYNPEKILEETDDSPKKVELGLGFSCQKIHDVH